MSILTIWVHDQFARNTETEENSSNSTNITIKPVTNIFTKWSTILFDKYFK
jgi:hypothetical protein